MFGSAGGGVSKDRAGKVVIPLEQALTRPFRLNEDEYELN